MPESKSIIGLDLNVDQDYIAKAVQQCVIMGISEALNGKNEIVSQLVNAVISTRVDADGKLSTYSNNHTQTLLQYYVKKLITDVVKEELQVMVNEKRGEISEMVRKKLNSKATTDKMTGALCEMLEGAINDTYRTKIEVNFEAIKRSGY
jgi:DNA relaxase NicK